MIADGVNVWAEILFAVIGVRLTAYAISGRAALAVAIR